MPFGFGFLFFVGYAQFFFSFLDNGTNLGQDIIFNRVGRVIFQNTFRLRQRPLVDIRGAFGLPAFPRLPVDEFGRGCGSHVFIGRFMADKILADANLVNRINRQGLIVYRNSLNRVFNHFCELIVHDKLAVIDCHAHFDHSQTVYQVGACQRW